MLDARCSIEKWETTDSVRKGDRNRLAVKALKHEGKRETKGEIHRGGILNKMNIIDYILTGIVFLYALFGFAIGIIKQLFGLLSIAFSLLAGALFYIKTGNFLLLPVVIIAAGITFKVAIYVIKKMCFDPESEKPKISLPSRIGGGLIGGFKGAVFVFIILLCLNLSMGFSGPRSTAIYKRIKRSFFYSCISENNLLLNIKITRNIHFASKLLKENQTIILPDDDEGIRKLKENPLFKAVANDKDLQESIQNKDYKKILFNSNVRKLLNDKDFIKQMCAIDYEAIYNQQKE